MSKIQIAWLELGTVGGLGVILVLAGIIITIAVKRKNDLCTQKTNGVVIKYAFPGNGRMYPIVEYIVDGKFYQAKKRFCGVKLTKISGFPLHMQPKAYEDEKGWLHVKIGSIANLHQYAEQLWPIGSEMTVYYHPNNPKKCYIDRPISAGFTAAMFIIMGLVTIVLGALTFFLIQHKL
ncbi:MAG TPA: hypothetical protein IAC31_07750 [Candidatus Faecousia intestinigallinarum]|nr:hypothetical protein [Candidatus Faecousia intestinigallinarum]